MGRDFPAGLLFRIDKSRLFQKTDIRRDILNVPLQNPGQMIYRRRMLRFDCMEQLQPFLCQCLAKCLDISKVHTPFMLHFFARFNGPCGIP
jgi:hypothetical protein